MKLALEAAWQFQGLTFPNPAVGCSIIKDSCVLAVGAHEKAGEAHAEVLALKKAYLKLIKNSELEKLSSSFEIHDFLRKNHNNIFNDCEIYVTLEPCNHKGKTPACSELISIIKPKKLYISVLDPNAQASGGMQSLVSEGIVVENGLCEEEGKALIEPFVKWQKKNFIFFKWAQRLDGTIDGGIVTDRVSREKVHAMRDVCDLLVIGGNTVRKDQPILDARLVNGKAPDVLIYSTQTNFSKDLALFKVEGRKVYIEDNFDKLSKYKNILIEGGPSMLKATQAIVDRYLCFLAPTTGGDIKFSDEKLDLKIVNNQKLDNDLMIWMDKR